VQLQAIRDRRPQPSRRLRRASTRWRRQSSARPRARRQRRARLPRAGRRQSKTTSRRATTPGRKWVRPLPSPRRARRIGCWKAPSSTRGDRERGDESARGPGLYRDHAFTLERSGAPSRFNARHLMRIGRSRCLFRRWLTRYQHVEIRVQHKGRRSCRPIGDAPFLSSMRFCTERTAREERGPAAAVSDDRQPMEPAFVRFRRPSRALALGRCASSSCRARAQT